MAAAASAAAASRGFVAAWAAWLAAATLAALVAGPRPVAGRLGVGAVSLTSASFESFVQGSDRVLVDFVDRRDARWREQQAELESALRQVRDFGCRVPFGVVDVAEEAELAARLVPNGRYPQLLWFLHGEPTQYHRTLRTAKGIADFVLALDRDPLVLADDPEMAKNFNPAILAQIPKGSAMFKALAVVASQHMDTVAVVVVESSLNEVTWLCNETEPERYTGEVTVAALGRWVRSLQVKSEPPPSGPEAAVDGGSMVVVGRTFEDLVLRQDKDVYLLVYAPWCGFSRKFFPVWEAFARAVAQVPHLVVAKMDGDRNGSPFPSEISWASYPTLLYFKAGQRTPAVFHGNRTIANLVQFASQHGSRPISLDPGVTEATDAEL